MKLTIKEMTYISLFTSLIAIGAFIKIEAFLVPLTLQVFFVLLSINLLNKKLSIYSVFLYLFIGLIGFPIFTKGGGLSYIIQPTFGYLIGFLIATIISSNLLPKNYNFKNYLIVGLIAITIIYLSGFSYFLIIEKLITKSNLPLGLIFLNTVLLPLPNDLFALGIVLLITKRLKTIIKI